jgi:hypothetical protein
MEQSGPSNWKLHTCSTAETQMCILVALVALVAKVGTDGMWRQTGAEQGNQIQPQDI